MSGRQISRIGGRYGNSSSSSSSSSSFYSPMNKFGISCDVCCHSIPGEHRRAIFAMGPCDHPICYHCSAKMRVLCEQNECPICRQEVSEIIFTEDSRKKFSDFDLSRFFFNDKFKIYFETQSCYDTFNSLLEEKCKKCKTTLENVNELQDHLWDKHRLLTCEVCVQNLKIFSEERKYYNAGQLEAHMKIGDPDDRSYQGHPACQLCNQRYVDSEELNRHLRRDHYFCHLCDTSKIIYFNKYETLNQHFREKHYLCEEGPCKNEQFTSVFRTAIDLQAHKAQSHCLTKSEAKHARTLNLDFTFNTAPRGPRAGGFNPQVVATLNDDGLSNSRGGGNRRGRGGDRGDRIDRGNDRNPPNISEDVWMTDDLSILGAVGPERPIQLRPEDFPSLGETSKQSPLDRPDNPLSVTAKAAVAKVVTNGVTSNQDSKASKKPKHKFSTKVKESATFGKKDDEEFPALCVPDLKVKGSSSNRSVQQASSSAKSISLADAVKSNPKATEKTTSQTVDSGKTSKVTNSNSLNRIANELIDHSDPSSSQDFSLTQNDFPSLPFKVNGNRKKKKSLNILLASLNNPQPDPPPNYTSVRLVDTLIPKENNGSTSNRSENENTPSLEEDMESLLLKEDNFPPLSGESNKKNKMTIKPSGQSKSSGPTKSKQPTLSSLVRPPPGYEKRNLKKPASSELSMEAVAQQLIKPKIMTATVTPTITSTNPTTTNTTTNTTTTTITTTTNSTNNILSGKKPEVNSNNHIESNNSYVSNSISDNKSGNKPTSSSLSSANNQRKVKRENFDQPPSSDRINSKSAKQSSSPKSTVNSTLSQQSQLSSQSTASIEKYSNSNRHQNGTNRSTQHYLEESAENSYIYPKDFDERNRRLFDMVQSILKDRFKDFDQISRAFFKDDIPPHQYYNKCVEMFRNKLNHVLLDLIVLLPDIRKQKHLMAAHDSNIKQRIGNIPMKTGVWEITTDSELDVVVCPMCGQVLSKRDGPDHITKHQRMKT